MVGFSEVGVSCFRRLGLGLVVALLASCGATERGPEENSGGERSVDGGSGGSAGSGGSGDGPSVGGGSGGSGDGPSVGGGSGEGGESGGDGGAGGALSIQEFFRQYNDAYCGRVLACCTKAENLELVKQCINGDVSIFGGASDPLSESIEQGRLVLDGEAARACVDTLAAMSCQEYADAHPSPLSCPSLVKAQVVNGAPCFESYECISGSCERDRSSEEPGSCEPMPGPGEACPFGNCPDGYFCNWHTGDQLCTPLRGEGESCYWDGDCESKYCADFILDNGIGHCKQRSPSQWCSGGEQRPACPGNVTFADPALEAAVRSTIGPQSGPISGERAALLRSLNAQGVASLSGAECLVNLSSLDLSSGSISDLTPLAELASLTSLNLIDNPIADIAPLAELTNLTNLYLARGQVTDIAPLAELTKLTVLDLRSNQITDITPLASLTNLTDLDLRSNQITDITPLAGLSNLRALELADNRITAIPPLPGLTMGSLNFAHNEITDISGLAGMTSLLELSLAENQITDLTPLAGLPDLAVLFLDENQVANLTPLAGLTSLTRLRLAGNDITDLTPLAGLGDLSVLYLENNQVTDVAPLAGLALSELNLSNNPITDLAPLVASMCPFPGPPGIIVHLEGLPGEPFCNDPNVAALAACRVFLLYSGGC